MLEGHSAQWGRDCSRRTSDQRLDFAPDEVPFSQTPADTDEMRTLHAEHGGLPGFRTGVTLEPGMKAFLETELQRVDRVTQLAARPSPMPRPRCYQTDAPDWSMLQPTPSSTRANRPTRSC